MHFSRSRFSLVVGQAETIEEHPPRVDRGERGKGTYRHVLWGYRR